MPHGEKSLCELFECPNVKLVRAKALEKQIKMAQAMKFAIQAGRLAFQSGRITKRLYATASSPVDGVISTRPR